MTLKSKFGGVLLLVAGVIHLLPVVGVLGSNQIEKLYGMELNGDGLTLLLQHRAVLFGLLGALLTGAVFQPAWRRLAIIAGLVSTVSFLVLAWPLSELSDSLRRVAIADVIALACLCGAALFEAIENRAGARPVPAPEFGQRRETL